MDSNFILKSFQDLKNYLEIIEKNSFTRNQIGATNPNADTRNADIASPKENSWRRTQGSMKVASPGLHEETQ